jgi:Abortive infection C-terminus
MPITNSGFEESYIDIVIRLQNGMIARAVGDSFENSEYSELRRFLVGNPELLAKVPDFLKRCSDIDQFWGFIKYEAPSYRERREIIWKAFRPLIEYLEMKKNTPGLQVISDTLDSYDSENIQSAWQKALDRRFADAEGAITAAKTLVESVCKHVLDDTGGVYGKNDDLPKLWGLASEKLNLSPHQHQEEAFKVILGNCQAVVNTLANIRNRVGDAHGQGRNPVKPLPRHAELVVNLAGTMSAFMIATLRDKSSS